jgi:hypothetical protein
MRQMGRREGERYWDETDGETGGGEILGRDRWGDGRRRDTGTRQMGRREEERYRDETDVRREKERYSDETNVERGGGEIQGRDSCGMERRRDTGTRQMERWVEEGYVARHSRWGDGRRSDTGMRQIGRDETEKETVKRRWSAEIGQDELREVRPGD